MSGALYLGGVMTGTLPVYPVFFFVILLTFSGYFGKWLPKLNYSNENTEEP